MNLLMNRRMAMEFRSSVKTFAPPVLFACCTTQHQREQGYGAANMWKQRANR